MTPGPWTARPHSANAGASYVQAAPRRLAPGRVVACGLTHEDARAIAALPDLLAALHDLVDYAAECAANNDERPVSLVAAHAALQKAGV